MTLKEIAKEAGVSVSTVSRVINQENTKAASPKVQARIWEIIRRTGYSPNKTARNLKLGQSAELRDPDPKSIACVYARTPYGYVRSFLLTDRKGFGTGSHQKSLFHSLLFYFPGPWPT